MESASESWAAGSVTERPGRPVADRVCWGLSRVVLPALNGAMAGIVFLQVVLRYLFNAPLSWTDELARLFVIWMVYLGLALTARGDSEVVMSGLIDVLPVRLKANLLVLRDAGVVIFVVVAIVSAAHLTLVDRTMTTAAMEISWAWGYAPVAIGLALYALETFPAIFRRLWRSRAAAAAWVIALALGSLGMTLAAPAVAGTLTALTPIVLLLFFFIEMPVAFALGIACLYYLVLQGGIPLITMPRSFAAGLDSFTLMALPFFILAGELMNAGGVTALIIRFALALVGHIRGGLGHVSVVTNMIMAGMSGSALADTAATGTVLIPAMVKAGFAPGFAASLIAATGAIGPMIPPSIFFIIYGGLARVSIAKLFLGGVIPGLLMGVFLMAMVYVIARRRHYPVQPRATVREVGLSLRAGALAFMMPLFVVGGMIAGAFTATEAGAIAVFYAIGLGVWYRQLGMREIWACLERTAVVVAAIMVVLSMANFVSYIASRAQVPQTIMDLLLALSSTPWVALLIVNVFLLVLGCFEAVMPILIVLTPILVPALSRLGIDPVHFGVVFTLNLLIGLLTPPFGASMFLVVRIGHTTMKAFIVEGWPFILALVVLLFLLTYFPTIVLLLPRHLG